MSGIRPVTASPRPGGGVGASGPLRRFVIASQESAVWHTRDFAPDVLWLDPLRTVDAAALGPLQPPNEGPADTAVPRWAVYDCAEVPGAVIGFLRTPVCSADDPSLDFLSLVLATPLAEPGAYHLYGLTVRSEGPEGEVQSLRLRTLWSAMDLLQADRATMVFPWSSPVVRGLPTLGTVEILAADTPLHGPVPAPTLMLYGAATPSPRRLDPPAYRFSPDSPELSAVLNRLRDSIESGRRFLLREPDAASEGGTLAVCEVAHDL